jgi:hypothetical protein
MAIKIELKRSAVPGKVPSTSSLELGEVAINTYDGKAYFKKDDGTQKIVQLADVSGSVVSASYAETASYALNTQNIDTGSLVSTSSFNAYTSSINTYTQSLNSATSSFATTGSNIFKGTQVLSGITPNVSSPSLLRLSGSNGQNAIQFYSGSAQLGIIINIDDRLIISNPHSVAKGITLSTDLTGSIELNTDQVFVHNDLRVSGSILIGTDTLTPTANEKLLIDAENLNSYNLITARSNVNNYSQFNIKNQNSGSNASTDIVATNDIGTEGTYYVDLGINSSQFAGQIGGPNDAYLYTTGSNLLISNLTNNKNIIISSSGNGIIQFPSNVQVTGSLTVSGSNTFTNIGPAVFSGSINVTNGVTGSLLGTSSYANNADTLDGIHGSQLVLTSSFNSYTSSINAYTASINNFTSSITTATGSFATTESFNAYTSSINSYTSSLNLATSSFVRNSQTSSMSVLSASYAATSSFANNFTVTNTLTAQTLVVQTVSSSIVYSSGSNRFGNDLTNTQVFTGSVIVTGSLSLNGSNVVLTNQTSSFASTSSFNAYTSSINTYTQSLNSATSSFATSASFNSFSASINTYTQSLNAATGAFATFTALNNYTSSINSYTSSLNNATSSFVQNSQTGAFATFTALNNYTSSTNNFTSSILSYTQSLNAATGAFATFTALNNYTSSLNNFSASILSYTASQNNLNGTYATTSSLNAYTSSINTYTQSLNAATSSFVRNSQTSSMSVLSASYAATASNILGGKATHIPFYDTDTTLATSSLYQSGSTSIIINQDSNTSANPEALYVFQPHPTSINVISGKGNLNNYLQLNIQNTNQGASASSDIVATANNGNESSNYIDMGINSENYASGFVGEANDAYLYSTGRHLHLGNVSNYPVQIFAGGSDTDLNRKLELSPDNQHQMTGSLDISGSLKVLNGVTGSFSGSLAGTASFSNNATSASYAATSSFVPQAIITASAVDTTITFTRFDGSTFNVTTTQSGSVASASFAENARSASYALTASYALNTQQVDTASFTSTSSFNAYTSSINTYTSSLNAATGAFVTYTNFNSTTSSLNAFSASILTYTQSLNAATGAFATFTALNNYTSSTNAFSASILSYTASQNNLNGTYATTSSLNAYTSSINTYTSSLNNKTSSFATTGSNIFVGNQVISGSLTVFTGSGVEFQVTDTGTKIGNSLNDNHTVTGSLLLSGSILSQNGSNVVLTNQTSSFTLNSATGSLVRVNQTSSMAVASASVVSGTSGQLLAKDDRIIEPNSISSKYLQFGFTSWNNDNSSPYADYLHLRSYTDASGGNDNLIVFRKTSTIGMRIWQQTWNSTSSYSDYRDVTLTLSGSAGYIPFYTTDTTITGSVIFQSSGNIGIKKITPSTPLDVLGDTTITGSLRVTGSITSTGTLTAQTLVVQTVSSSVIYSSGSNVFGNSLANTQVFTGSVIVTGSLSVNGSDVVLTNQTSSFVQNSQTGAFATFTALNAYTSSINTYTSSLNSATGAFATFTALNAYTSSINTYTSSLNSTTSSFATSASFNAYTSSLNSATSSFATSASFNAYTSSINSKTSSFATTGSNNFVGNQTITGSILHSGSLIQVGSNTITGSLNISGSTTQIGNNTLLGNTTLSGSLTISGSAPGSATNINIYGDTSINGAIKFLPTVENIDTTVSASYIFVSGSTQDLYFSQNGNGYANTTRLRWLEGNLYTGLLHGGLIGTASSTVYTVQSGSGIIVDLNASIADSPYPTVQYLEWGTLSASIAPQTGSYDQTFVSINTAGNIYAQGTPYFNGQLDSLIPLGIVLHQNRSTINGTKTQPSVAYGIKQRQNIFISAFGPLKLSGHTLATSSSLGLLVGSGTSFSDGANYQTDPNNPSYVTDPGITVSKIFRYRQSGSGWVYDTNGGAGYTTIDPTQYSLNGTLTAVPGTGANREFSIQRVFHFPNSVSKAIVVYYGNDTYTTLADARANLQYEPFSEAPNTAANAIYLGAIIVRNDAVFTDTDTFRIEPGGLFRQVGGTGGGGSVVTQTLAGLSDVQISGPTSGQSLIYDSTATKWRNLSFISASISGNAATATSASYAATSSFVPTGIVTASAVNTTITFTRFNGTTFDVTVSQSGSVASASYAENAGLLDGLDSTQFTLTNSFNAFSASINTYTQSLNAATGAFVTYTNFNSNTSSFNAFSASILSYTSSLNAATGAFATFTALNNYTSSTNAFSASILSYTASQNNLNGTYATTSSFNAYTSSTNAFSASILSYTASNNTTNTTQNNRLTGLENYTQSLNSATSSFVTYTNFNSTTSSLNNFSASILSYTSSLNAATSSFVLNSQTSSFVLNSQTSSMSVLSASYAQTASFASNFTVANTLTAQTLVVQTVSSSIIYSSGSNVFGNSLANTQVFTGSVIITGSASINGSNIVLANQTSSLVTYTNFNSYTSSLNTYTQSLNSATGAFATFTALNAYTSSINTYTSSLNSATSSFVRNSQTSSMSVLSASFAITASTVNVQLAPNVVDSYAITFVGPSSFTGAQQLFTTASSLSFDPGAQTLTVKNINGTASFTTTASYANNANLLDGLDSTQFTLTSSFNTYTQSLNAATGTFATFTALNAYTASTNAFSASILTYTQSLNAATGAFATFTALNAYTSSTNAFSASILSYTSSLNAATSSFVRNSQTSSMTVLSSSYAVTSSYSRNLIVDGTLTFDATLNDYASVASSIVGSNNLFTQPTSSYTSGFFKYTVRNGTNARTGEVMAVWNGTSVEYTDMSTRDLGNTADVTFAASIVTGNLQFNATTATSGWNIKTLATYI